MLISNTVMHALDDIAVRERDVLQAFTPGAQPAKSDVARRQDPAFTMNPLSAAAPADSYFLTSDDRGRTLFTRDGSFRLRDGALVDESGNPVLGYVKDGAPLGPLRADPVDLALGFANSAHVEADGSVVYERATIDPRTGRREVQHARLGRVALARFAAGTKLQAVDPQHVTAPAGIAPHVGKPGDENFGALQPYARESSGIDIDLGLQRLQEAYLALDAIRAAGKAQGGIQKTAMDLLK
jgi:flagellar basal body rod protein FlgG